MSLDLSDPREELSVRVITLKSTQEGKDVNVIWQLSDPWADLAALVTVAGFIALYYGVVRKRNYNEQKRRRNPVARTWAWWWRSAGAMVYWTLVLGVVYFFASSMFFGRGEATPELLESLFNGAALGAILFWPALLLVGTFRAVRSGVRRRKV